MTEVTLSQVLSERERRYDTQKQLINKYCTPVICFTMNIAGPVKNSLLIDKAFREGIEILESKLNGLTVLYKSITSPVAGPCAFYSVNTQAEFLKDICVSVEESSEIGRLFDIDVINNNGRKIERKIERNCLICSAKGRMCAATRKHDYKTLQAKTNEIITNHFLAKDSKRIGQLATESLLKEVYTTPKPGLVDRRNCGSHKDMEIKTFENSAYSLAYYFTECFKTGYISANKKPEVTLSKLRQLGKNAEKTMYDATNGINTHKGAIFSLGILCGSCGKLWSPIAPNFNVNEIVLTASKIYANAMIDDFDRIKDTTAGGRQYIETGIKGIRGEVASAFSSVINSSLPAYSDALENGMSSNHAGAIALLHLISTVEDTNLYHRGGYEGAAFAKNNARKLLQNNNYPPLEQIEKLDDEFIVRNLSPGGCADLLAVTYFLYSLTQEF